MLAAARTRTTSLAAADSVAPFPSIAISRPRVRRATLRPRARILRQPVDHRLEDPRGLRPPLRPLEVFPDLLVLVVDRALGVDRHELEDEGERLVLANHATDELRV